MASFIGPKTGSRVKAYFLGLSVALFASLSIPAYHAISSDELKAVLKIAVDPDDDDHKIYATQSMYHLVRFYLNNKDIKKFDEENMSVLTPEMEELRKDNDIVIFAQKGEIGNSLLKKSRTIDARKFRLHLFSETK